MDTIAIAIVSGVGAAVLTIGAIAGITFAAIARKIKKTKIAKIVKRKQDQEKTDLIIKAIKLLSAHAGMNESNEMKSLRKFDKISDEVIAQIKENILAEAQILDDKALAKVSKKATKQKI